MSTWQWIAVALVIVAYRYSQHEDNESPVTDTIHASYDYIVGKLTIVESYKLCSLERYHFANNQHLQVVTVIFSEMVLRREPID